MFTHFGGTDFAKFNPYSRNHVSAGRRAGADFAVHSGDLVSSATHPKLRAARLWRRVAVALGIGIVLLIPVCLWSVRMQPNVNDTSPAEYLLVAITVLTVIAILIAEKLYADHARAQCDPFRSLDQPIQPPLEKSEQQLSDRELAARIQNLHRRRYLP